MDQFEDHIHHTTGFHEGIFPTCTCMCQYISLCMAQCMTVSHLIDAVFPFCSSSLTPSTRWKPEEQKESVLNDSSILAVHIPVVPIASFTANNEHIKYIYTLPFKGG